jgi:cytochrome P450
MYIEETRAKASSAFIFTNDVISNVRRKLSDDHEEEDKPTTFMRALLSPKFKLSSTEIRDEVKTLLIAAQDTTGISISATLLLLAMHKDKQAKVIEEMRRVIGNSADVPITDFEKLNELSYLEMVINEALRLIPVVPFVFRSVDSEVTSSEGYVIPPNANLIIPIFKIHRNKTFWGDDADEFKPERFEKEAFKKVNSYAFIPFTRGPRMCLGWRYAMQLMKIQLCNFLMRYEVDTSLKFDELEFELNVTLNICQGFKISIAERKM